MEVPITQIEGVKSSIEARTHTIVCDQPQENGGTDAGMTPPEFLLASRKLPAAALEAQLAIRTLLGYRQGTNRLQNLTDPRGASILPVNVTG